MDLEELKDTELTEIENVVLAGQITKKYPILGTVIIKHPTIEVESEASNIYSKKFSTYLDSGLLTISEMEKKLSSTGKWTDKDDEDLDKLREGIINKSITIEQILYDRDESKFSKKETEELNALKAKRDKIESDFFKKTLEKTLYFENTVERKAEDEALYYKVSKCVFKEDETPVWGSFEKFKKQIIHSDIKKLLNDCIVFWRGIDSPLLENLVSQINGKQDTQ